MVGPALRGALVLAVALAALASLGCGEREPADAPPAVVAPPAPPRELSEAEIIQRFVDLWRKRRAVFQSRFLGVSTLQNPTDAWIIQELISEVEPDFVVETGTYHGGSAVYWAMLLEHINPEARVITIDIADQREQRAIDLPISRRKVDFLLGSSTDPALVADVTRRVAGKRVLVILDSAHTAEHVLAELEAYSPLVGVGSYIVVQDTPVGPIRAIREFLSRDDRFEIDRSRERFLISNTVQGYLRRVR